MTTEAIERQIAELRAERAALEHRIAEINERLLPLIVRKLGGWVEARKY